MIKYGIIGCGMMGREHIRNILLIPNTSIVGIYEPNPEMCGLAKVLAPSAEFCGTLTELLTTIEFDCLVIATPNFQHIDDLYEILKYVNKPVLIEKPIVTKLEDTKRINDFLQKYKAPVWVAMEYRYMPVLQEFIQQEKLVTGGVKMLSIREHRYPFLEKVKNWNRFNKNTGGTLVEKCCHFFDLMNLMMPSKPIKVYASGDQSVNHLDEQYDGKIPDIIDNSFVLIDYEDGQRAMLDLCMFAEGGKYEQEIILTGDRGKLETRIPGNELLLTNRKLNSHSTIEIKEDTRVKEIGFHHGASYVEHLELIECIKTGNQPLVNCLDGLNSIILGMAAQESIKTGEAVNLKEFLKN